MNEANGKAILESLVGAKTDERMGLPSASAWHRYELCRASYLLGAQAKEIGQEAFSKPSPESARGEAIHHALETGDLSGLDESDKETVGFLEERAAGEVKRIFGDTKVQILNEVRFWLEAPNLSLLNVSGQIDRLYFAGKTAMVVDWKTGWSEPVKAEHDAQLKVLAVLAAKEMHFETVHVRLVSGPFGVFEHEYDLAGLAKAYDEIVATLKAINDSDAKPTPGPQQCRFCPAASICPAVHALRKPIAEVQFMGLPDANEKAADLLAELEVLDRHIEAIREYYTNRIKDNENYKIPGWGLVTGTPRRVVPDWPSARRKLEEFIDAKDLDALATFTLSKVEKLLGETIGVKGARLTAQFNQVLGDSLQLQYPEPSLKKIKEKL